MARVCFTFCSTIRTVVPSSRIFLMTSKISRDEDRREAQRRLVEHHELRERHESPADRDHLLLAAGKRSGELSSPLPEPREEPNTISLVFSRFCLASPRSEPMSRFSSTVISTKSRRASGQRAMPISMRLYGLDGMDRGAVEQDDLALAAAGGARRRS